jgi:hypothetical protein
LVKKTLSSFTQRGGLLKQRTTVYRDVLSSKRKKKKKEEKGVLRSKENTAHSIPRYVSLSFCRGFGSSLGKGRC